MSRTPTANPPIRPSSSASGSVIRKAFLLEACANLLSLPLLTHTRSVLPYLVVEPRQINPPAVLFARLFGGIVVGGLTTALLAGYRNTRNGIESRRIVYLILGVGEVFLIPVLYLEGLMNGNPATAALTKHAAWGSIGLLAPPLLWRLYTLLVRPDLFGRYDEIKRE